VREFRWRSRELRHPVQMRLALVATTTILPPFIFCGIRPMNAHPLEVSRHEPEGRRATPALPTISAYYMWLRDSRRRSPPDRPHAYLRL